MTIDRRLHHAARELREVPIGPPAPPRPAGRGGAVAKAMALAAPVVVLGAGVLGGAALLQVDSSVDHGDVTAAVVETTNPPSRVIGPDHVESVTVASVGRAPTPVEEVAMISALGAGADRPGPSVAPPDTAAPANAT